MVVHLGGPATILTLSRISPGSAVRLDVYASMDEALQHWGASSRCSPVFPLNRSEWPKKGTSFCAWFVGPLYPGCLPQGISAFLSLGLYNLVLIARSDEEAANVKAFLAENPTVAWESWTVAEDGSIGVIGYAERLKEVTKVFTDLGGVKLHGGLHSMTDEYRTLVAATVNKAQTYTPEVAAETRRFDAGFREYLESKAHRDVIKSQWLVNVNAALSRYSSQTFAGISPITETECHYWTHSLLGVGMATQALVMIRRQVQVAFDRADFRNRLKALASLPPNSSRLDSLKPRDGYWQHHHLPKLAATGGEQMTPIVFFSGRDGFRSTAHTLSVPLEVISAANTIGWSLRTLTHELSHVFVDTILGALLPTASDPQFTNRIARLFESEQVANLLEDLQAAMCWALFSMTRRNGDDVELSGEELADIIRQTYPEVSEILTHIFDFQYFYQSDPEIYIASIWASWDVIPNILDRVPEYLVRTLSAIMVLNLTAEDPFRATADQVEAELKKLSALMPEANIIQVAIEVLKSKRDDFRKQLISHMQLVAISKAFFYSQDIAAIIGREKAQSRRAKEPFKANEFDADVRVDNSLSFVYRQSRRSSISNEPDPVKSAWIMTHLAFASAGDDDE